MKFKLTATDTKQGGRAIAELDIDKPSRESALSEGIVQLLSGSVFPPEALQLYRGALDRQFSRDEALDGVLEHFGVQFFIKELAGDAPIPPSPNPSFPAAQPTPTTAVPQTGMMSPRQMLRAQLANLRIQEAAVRKQREAINKQYAVIKGQVDECRMLLGKKSPEGRTKRARRHAYANGRAEAPHVQ